jgi:hypothetical protein
MKMKRGFILLMVLAVAAMLFAGCAPYEAPSSTPAPTPAPTPPATLPTGTGILEIRVTDPPPPDMDHIWVKLQSLEIHKTGGSWITIDDVEETEPFDLKAIEGLEAYLASQVVEVGRYTQIRLGVEPGAVTVDIDEDIEGDEYDAKVPSEKIKLVGTFEVVENGTTVITLDFDGMKSVHVTGSGDYMFKPVIKLIVKRPSPAPVAPTVTSVDPNTGNQDQTLDVTIAGTGFTGGTLDSFGDGITINSSTVDSDTQITANITIDPGAILGTRDVTVTTPGGTDTLTAGFEVTAP